MKWLALAAIAAWHIELGMMGPPVWQKRPAQHVAMPVQLGLCRRLQMSTALWELQCNLVLVQGTAAWTLTAVLVLHRTQQCFPTCAMALLPLSHSLYSFH